MLQKIQVMIVEDNQQLAESIRNYFEKKNIMDVIGLFCNSEEAIKMMQVSMPDVIILDLVMPRSDGFVLLEHLQSTEYEKKPEVLVLSSLSHETIIKRACDLGAVYYMVKPFSVEDLHNRVQDISGIRILQQEQVQAHAPEHSPAPKHEHTGFSSFDSSLPQRISTLLMNIGIPTQNIGYQYLSEAVKMVVASPILIHSITKKLYPEIGDAFDTSPVNVERAIRHAIDVAWQSGRLANFNEIYSCKVIHPHYRPANGEFISLLSSRLAQSPD